MSEFASGSLTGKNLHLSFGSNHVLRGIDLHVEKGTTASVIGPSGSGKSTLLRVMNRLIEPDQGDILLDGRSVLKDNPDELRQRIGMVFQQFNLFPHKTVVDNVSLALRKLRKLPAEQARDEALEQLDLVGLKHKADARPANLSGGQQQRVAIARALAMKPEVMFFDEATSRPRSGARQGCPCADGRPRQGRHDHGGGDPRDGLLPQRLGHRDVHGRRRRCRVRSAGTDLYQPADRTAAGVPHGRSVVRRPRH